MSLSSNPSSYAGDRKDSGQSGDAALSTLLNANNLDSYVLPSALSVTVARSFKQSYPVANTYDIGAAASNSSTVSFVLTPGADYVYGPDSFFTFKYAQTNPGSGVEDWFGEHGSVLNIFKSIRLTHASGTEIEYIDNLNLLNSFKMAYERDETYRSSEGTAFGMTHRSKSARDPLATPVAPVDVKNDVSTIEQSWVSSGTGGTGRYVTLVNGEDVRFAVPLSALSEFFNSDKLLPPYVLAGMRIELELASPNISLQAITVSSGTTAAPNTLEVTQTLSDLRMQLDSHTLTDSVAKAIARMSANEGLDIHFSSWFHDRHQMTNQSSTINITKALSRVEDITLVPRIAAHTTDTIATTQHDSLRAKAYETQKWQISIGSMFFPSHPVERAAAAYRLAVQGRRHMAGVDMHSFAVDGLGVLRGAMERSQILNGSGIAVSATRGATIHVTDSKVPLIDLFVKHTRLCSVFLDNVVVRT
jgi:hypothetical protein